MVMKKHNGMRPQDIVVLLKIISMQNQVWRNIDIANALNLSPSEVSEALNRSKIAKLIDGKKKSVNPNSFKEFLIYGLKYVFPVEPGAIVRGIPTAHSAPPISENISQGGDIYVWPYGKGIKRGQSIEPLYKTVPEFALKDKSLYELLALTDTLRVGRAREIKIAIEELEKRMKYAK
jgi:DNA-binding Lrp family transcriptional regulator